MPQGPICRARLLILACLFASCAQAGADVASNLQEKDSAATTAAGHAEPLTEVETILPLPDSRWVTVEGRSVRAWTPGGAEAWVKHLEGQEHLLLAPNAAADGSVFLRDPEFIWCVDARGKVAWKHQARLTASMAKAFAPVPTTSSEAVVQLEAGKVGVISKTGELLWSRDTPEKQPLASAPSVLANGLIIVTTKLERMALAPLDGRLSWQVPHSRLAP